MSPMEAQEIAEVLEGVDESNRDAFAAYLRHFNITTVDSGAVSDFEDAYAGERESFRDYADEIADETIDAYAAGLAHGSYDTQATEAATQWLVGYFNWEQHARELEMDYGTEDAPNGNVYIFRAV